MPGVAERRRTGGAKRGVGETRALVRRHTLKGLDARDISLLLGISTAAVYQHLRKLREAGELNHRRAS